METSAISYRVADFLKKHPPFHAMEEADLLDLAGRGRVKFFEAHDYIVVQGNPYMFQLFVIQQGTVTLWDEERETVQLQDVRGAGDFLGIEQFNGLDAYIYSARSASDVVVYSFPAIDFESLVLKYPYARQYVAAYGNISGYKQTDDQRDIRDMFIHDLVAGKHLHSCDIRSSVRDAARKMLSSGSDVLAVVDSENRARGMLTADSFLEWISKGGGDAGEPVARLIHTEIPSVASDSSVAEAALAMSRFETGALAITEDGTPAARLHAVVTSGDMTRVFGDHPVAILQEIRRAAGVRELRDLNQRSRAFVLRHLNGAGSVEWLANFTSLVDTNIVKRLISLTEAQDLPAAWCFSGSAGRGETLTQLAPELVMIIDEEHDAAMCLSAYRGIREKLSECGYISAAAQPFDQDFYAAGLGEWKKRYKEWVDNPIFADMYRARPLFDLRRIYGKQSLWDEVDTAVRTAINSDFLYLLANDCLESLPPLTFFEEAVISESGEQSDVFRLEYSALGPLVDVGRVFGMASRKILASSTLERFAMARSLLPDRAIIFQEASDALRVVLWQQGRVGITRNDDGSELPPSLLGRYDRQILKSGFRSIFRLLEFTGNPQWLQTI